MIGDLLAAILVIGPVLWAIREADRLSAARDTALQIKIDALAESIAAARNEKAIRLSSLPGLNAKPHGVAAPPVPPSGVRIVQKDADIAADERETIFDRPSEETRVYGRNP